MRSRTTALLVAVLSVATGLLYWIGAAVVALTALRQGPKEAVIIGFWALLPALVIAGVGHEVAPLAALINIVIAASVLRLSNSWAYALVTVVIVSVVLAGGSYSANAQWLQVVEQQVQTVFSQLQASMGDTAQALVTPDKNLILSMSALGNALVTSLCLFGARAMHAALDKPHGFRDEFHQLRMPRGLAVGLVLASLVLMSRSGHWLIWAYIVGLPLFLHGLGFVHCAAARVANGRFTLIIVYVSVVMIGPAKVLIALLGFIDSWVDLRAKFAKPPHDL